MPKEVRGDMAEHQYSILTKYNFRLDLRCFVLFTRNHAQTFCGPSRVRIKFKEVPMCEHLSVLILAPMRMI
jgi:hypothetical protein